MPGSLQDAFLAECKRASTPVTVFLVNGFQLRGIVKGYDPFTVLLEYERKTHLIYKHAISTISPGTGIALGHGNGAAANAEPKALESAEES